MTNQDPTNMERLKQRRTWLAAETTKQHNKVAKYYKKLAAAQRAHHELSSQHEAVDREIFELDPGITVVRSFRVKKEVIRVDGEAVRKPSNPRKPITAKDALASIGPEAMKAMIAKIMKEKEEADGS